MTKSKPPTVPTEALYIALGLSNARMDTRKRYAYATARLNALGFAVDCPRCSGTGHYSFDGTSSTCYRCLGARWELPKTLDANYIEQVESKVKAGGLEPYFAEAKRRNDIKTAVKNVFETWKATGVSGRYDWMRAADGCEMDRRYSDLNRKISDAQEIVSKAETESRLAKGPEDQEEAFNRLAEAVNEFDAVCAGVADEVSAEDRNWPHSQWLGTKKEDSLG